MANKGQKKNVFAFTAISRVGPTQQVREQMFAAIERGDYLPGSALPSERVLCETFGVSRVSVREAIAGFEATGLIVVRHGRGAFVREGMSDQYAGPFGKYLEMHREEILELLKVRGALDELAAEQASLRGTETELEKITAAHEAFKQAVVDGAAVALLARLDVAFHMSIAEAAGGALLPSLLKDLNGILADSRQISLSRPGRPVRSSEQHQAILQAILTRDTKTARRAVSDHLTSTRELVQDLTLASNHKVGS
jgi:GntR family transcriptional repressor for pyruvate dehydrogenase complex